MELGETSATATIPEEPEAEQETIEIDFNLFFDGTQNNRTNIDQRLIAAEELADEAEREAAAELKKKLSAEQIEEIKTVYKKYGSKKNSYSGAYSNVVKLEKHLKTDAHSTEKLVLKSYIEGIGTVDKKRDQLLGYAAGIWTTGVKAKVKAGLREAAKEIENNHHNRRAMITTLTFNLFGFSRGAAAARHFIHNVLFSRPIIEQLKELGYQVGDVKVGFVGLFDTVSSHGLSFSNDTVALDLNAISHAQNVVHLTAADEHRKKFSLTDIKSADGGQEIFLPGVHSDIGGSYSDGKGEDQGLLWATGAFSAVKKAEKERNRLISAKWYKANELTLIHIPSGGVILKATRDTISNRYSRIPLHIMAEFAQETENKISFNDKFEKDEKIPPALDLAQQEIQTYVSQHKGKGARSSKAAHWHDDERSWLRDLRHGYCHFSAKLEFAHAPRYIDGQRRRMTYAG